MHALVCPPSGGAAYRPAARLDPPRRPTTRAVSVTAPTNLADASDGGVGGDGLVRLPTPPPAWRRALRDAVGTPPAAVDAIVGVDYEFSRAQEGVFIKLEHAMLAAASRYGLLAAAALLPAGGAHHHGPGAPYLAAAEACGAAFVAVSAAAASTSFALIPATRGRDLRHLLLGFSDLAAFVTDVAVLSVGLALTHVSLAAAAAPRLAAAATAGLTAAAVAARLALFHEAGALGAALAVPASVAALVTAPLRAVFRGARRAVRLVGRPVRAAQLRALRAASAAAPRRTPHAPPLTASVDGTPGDQEFTPAQETVVRRLVAALQTACFARLLHAACEAVAAVAAAAAHDAAGAAVAALGALEVGASAGVLLYATTALDRIVSTSGSDIAHALEGGRSLAVAFETLAHVVEAALVVKVAPVVLSLVRWGAGVAGAL
jgi:hypothetical protein